MYEAITTHEIDIQERDDLPRVCHRGCNHNSLDGREVAEVPGSQKSTVWDAKEAIHEKVKVHWLYSAARLPKRGVRGSS